MNENITEGLEYYEQGFDCGEAEATLLVYNPKENTVMTATEMPPLHFVRSMVTALGSVLRDNQHEQQFVQDVIMYLLHGQDIGFSDEFYRALPSYKDFPRYNPDAESISSTEDILSSVMSRD